MSIPTESNVDTLDDRPNTPDETRDAVALTPHASKTTSLRGLLSKYGTLIGLLLLIVFFSLTSNVFLTAGNINNILQASAILGVTASGLTVVMVLMDFDLSIALAATASGVLAAGTAQTLGTAGAWTAAIMVGVIVGVANGLIVTKLNVSAFIATLAVGQVIQGWLLYYRGGSQIDTGLPADFTEVGQGSLGPISLLVVVWAVLVFLLFILLEHTSLGRRMYAIGGNPIAARLSGIRVERVRLVAFLVSGITAAIGGLLLASNLGAGNPTAGLGYLLPSFAACFIGAATLRDGQFHIGGTLVGVLLLGILSNGLVLLGVSPAWTTAAQGLVLIAAVALSGFFRKLGAR
jgi:ribose transport system permease protein